MQILRFRASPSLMMYAVTNAKIWHITQNNILQEHFKKTHIPNLKRRDNSQYFSTFLHLAFFFNFGEVEPYSFQKMIVLVLQGIKSSANQVPTSRFFFFSA